MADPGIWKAEENKIRPESGRNMGREKKKDVRVVPRAVPWFRAFPKVRIVCII